MLPRVHYYARVNDAQRRCVFIEINTKVLPDTLLPRAHLSLRITRVPTEPSLRHFGQGRIRGNKLRWQADSHATRSLIASIKMIN